MDETLEVSLLEGEHRFAETDITGRQALRIRVYGNGSSEDAILISLRSTVLVEGGRTDYLIPLDHTGWKEFWLIDSDCGDTGDFVFDVATEGVDYECYRAMPELTLINSVTVSLCGPCEGVRLDDITACALSDGGMERPTLTVNGLTVAFETELRGGQYIEYDPADGTAFLMGYEEDGRTAFCREIPVTGQLILPKGEYTLSYSARSLSGAPARVRVVLGTEGALLTNPEDWQPPEVILPRGAARVWGLNG